MDFTSRTTRLLQQDALRWRCLQLARQLNLPDWYLGAGFLRNAIWDQLHQLPMTALNDIDLVYFDASDINIAREQQAEAWLQQQLPGYRFEVRNQARMHLLHGHAPYQDCADGISRWVEIPTCVGVRLQSNDQLSFTTAFGLAANWSLQVAMNPHYPRPAVFTERVRQKNWQQLWPQLQICWPTPTTAS